jgi:hypothetical protein
MEGVEIPGYFIVEFNGRKVVAPRPGPLEYHVRSSLAVLRLASPVQCGSFLTQELHARIRRYFPQIPSNYHISYHTTELAIGFGEEIEISGEAWKAVIPKIKKLIVKSTDPHAFMSQGVSNGPRSNNYPTQDKQVTVKITEFNDDGRPGSGRNHDEATNLTGES